MQRVGSASRGLSLRLAAIVVSSVALVSDASAALVTAPVTFGGAGNTFGATLGISGSLTGDGIGTVFPAPNQLAIDVPSQTVPILLSSGGSMNTVPSGSATVGFDDVTLATQTISGLDVNLFNGFTLNYGFQQITLNGTAVTGGQTVPLQVLSTITGTITNLRFVQDAGAQIVGGELAGRITADLTANLGLRFKLGFLTLPVNIDPLAFNIDEPLTIPANLAITDNEPAAAFPHDALVKMMGSVASLTIPVNLADPFIIDEPAPLEAHVTGSFALNINIALNNLGYMLQGIVPDVIVEDTGCVLVGDANNDGSVGAADYAIWAAQFGQSGAALAADFDHNGSVGAGDYALWAANFGNTCPAGAGSSVPEPSTLALAGVALLVGLVVRRKRSSK